VKVLLLFAVAMFLVVYCIKFAARQVDAKSSTGAILLCILVQSALTELSRHVVVSAPLQFAAAFAGGALVYSLLLDTTFKKGLVISLLSSAMIFVGLLVIVGVAKVSSGNDVAQASLREMQQRAAESQARDPGYNIVANQALMGDGSELRKCLRKSAPPENFVVYLEILPDGSLARLTEVGKCFREIVRNAGSRRRPAHTSPRTTSPSGVPPDTAETRSAGKSGQDKKEWDGGMCSVPFLFVPSDRRASIVNPGLQRTAENCLSSGSDGLVGELLA
jgi:hypothetical protein